MAVIVFGHWDGLVNNKNYGEISFGNFARYSAKVIENEVFQI